jgi:hypothetical protein
MDTQPSRPTEERTVPKDDGLRPIVIRKLDRLETTHQSSTNGG